MAPRDPRQGPRGAAPSKPSLPANFTEIKAILDGEVSVGNLVSVIGAVKDCRLPIATVGADFKSTFTLVDLSTEDEYFGIKVVMFRPEADMPKASLGDIVLLTNVKVQRFRSEPLSLITNHRTSIRIYAASLIPKPPQAALSALAPAAKRDSHVPTDQENHYVSYLYHKLDKDALPDEHEFQQRAAQSLNVHKKFRLLKDVCEGQFCDLIVRVARPPYAGFSVVTLYVSDYTENPHFHPHAWEGLSGSGPGDGDPYGYTSGGVQVPKTDWVGPYGKMSLQITCFEPHASYIQEEVTAGQWVALRNVQIKYGRDGRFLEGFMREDRNFNISKVNVNVLETTSLENQDPNLKEAIRRYRDYEVKKKKQLKAVKAAQAAGLKRKASLSAEQAKAPPNSRERRKVAREVKNRDAAPTETTTKPADPELPLELNQQVICETHDVPYATIASILEPPVHPTIGLTLPFACTKHQARVRVVDFFPPTLEAFARARTPHDYDGLSDNGDLSDSASSSHDDDDGDDHDDAAPGARIWEWRFALQLEDASPAATASPAPRLWALVDNTEAQCLTGLDATDLRRSPEALSQLRERMFSLWGNLEEVKARAAGHGNKKKRSRSRGGRRHRMPDKPPLESSDAEPERGDDAVVMKVSNRPFACCIKQYGVRERGEDDAGDWVRCFGLCGTKICS